MKYTIMTVTTDAEITQSNAQAQAKAELMQEEYDEWVASKGKLTLAEVLNGIGFNMSKSTHKYPQINIFGKPTDKTVVHYCDNPVAAMNAIADYKKYKSLKWGRHEAWFKPFQKAEDVLVEFIRKGETGFFRFWNWENLCFQPSDLNDMYLSKDDADKRDNMMAKHAEIETMMLAEKQGDVFAVVLGTEFLQNKWNEDVVQFLEKPYAEYLENRLENGKTQQAKRDTLNPRKGTTATAKNASPEHKAVAEAMLKLNGNAADYVLLIRAQSALRDTKVYLENKSQEDIGILAAGILSAYDEIVYKLVTVESLAKTK